MNGHRPSGPAPRVLGAPRTPNAAGPTGQVEVELSSVTQSSNGSVGVDFMMGDVVVVSSVSGGDAEMGYGTGVEVLQLSQQSRQAFVDLIYWKNIRLTAGLFAGMNIFFTITYWLNYTVMMLLGELLMWALAGSVAYHLASFAYARLNPDRRLVDKMQEYAPVNLTDVEQVALHAPVSMQGYARPLVGAVEGGLTIAIGAVREALLLTNATRALQIGLIGYAMAVLGRHFEAFTLVYVLLFLLFTVPKAWQELMQHPVVRQLMQHPGVRQHLRTGCQYGQVGWAAVEKHLIARIQKLEWAPNGAGGPAPSPKLRRRLPSPSPPTLAP